MKPIAFLGSSLASIRAFPTAVKREAGYELDQVQRGAGPRDWKAMPNLGPGVREIRIRIEGAWRVVYVASRADAIYVLHAFQKKTLKTRKQDIDAAKQAPKQLK